MTAWNTVSMRIWIFGVRGSTPTPGPEFVRYGGHTSCLAVALDGERPSLMVDAGTGIRLASDLFKGSPDLFNGRPYEGAILLGHMHWDHTQGLPFFAAGNSAGSRVDLYVPAQGDTESVLGRFMSPPHFPIAPSGLLGSWSFNALEPGEALIAGFSGPGPGDPAQRRTPLARVSRLRRSAIVRRPRVPVRQGWGSTRGGSFPCGWMRSSLSRRRNDEELPARLMFTPLVGTLSGTQKLQ